MRTVFTALVLFSLIGVGSVSGRDIHVGEDRAYSTLRSALDSAQDGDTVYVHEGVFAEGNIVIEKSLTLIGKGWPILDGKGEGEILTVKAGFFSIEGFDFRNSGTSFIHDNAAVKFDGVRKGQIIRNRFKNNYFAIYLANTSQCVVAGNEIISNLETETLSGNGIHLWYCKQVTVQDNNIEGQRDGIYLEFVEDSEVFNNTAKLNHRYGLHFMFSDRNRYWNNTFTNNGAGVAVMYSRNVEMWANTFEYNWGDASYGLLLKDIYDSSIHQNLFEQNTIGMLNDGCVRMEIKNNRFINNGWAVKIMANSNDNTFSFNDFIGNTFDVATNSRHNFNLFDRNYWSKYRGYDLDKNGVGDVPFHPVKLFSVLVEKNEPALILLRSLFVNLLDLAEEYIPLMTPEMLVDQKPLMSRVQ